MSNAGHAARWRSRGQAGLPPPGDERSAGRGSSQSPRPAQSTVERPLGLAAWQSMLHSRMIGGGAKTQPRRRPGATVLLKVPVVITPPAFGSADM